MKKILIAALVLFSVQTQAASISANDVRLWINSAKQIQPVANTIHRDDMAFKLGDQQSSEDHASSLRRQYEREERATVLNIQMPETIKTIGNGYQCQRCKKSN